MTEKELECAIKAHEMQRLELKESFGAETIESACAFANADGGYIVIGVDNRGNPSRLQLREEALRDYENRIVISGKAEHDRYWEYPLEALRAKWLSSATCCRGGRTRQPTYHYSRSLCLSATVPVSSGIYSNLR